MIKLYVVVCRKCLVLGRGSSYCMIVQSHDFPTNSKAASAHAIGHHMNTSNVLYVGL